MKMYIFKKNGEEITRFVGDLKGSPNDVFMGFSPEGEMTDYGRQGHAILKAARDSGYDVEEREEE